MYLFGNLLGFVLDVYFYILIARFVLELIMGVNRSFKPKGIWLVASEVIMTLTDGPLRLVRKVVKPVRIGNAGIDFSWTVILFVVAILRSLVNQFLG